LSLIINILLNSKALGLLAGCGFGFLLCIKKMTKAYLCQFIVIVAILVFALVTDNFEYIFRDRYEMDTYEIVQAKIIAEYVTNVGGKGQRYAEIEYNYKNKKRNARGVDISESEKEGQIIDIAVRKGKNRLKIIRPCLVFSGGTMFMCGFLIGYLMMAIVPIIEMKFYNKTDDSNNNSEIFNS